MNGFHTSPPSYEAATTGNTSFPRKDQADTSETLGPNISRNSFLPSAPLLDNQPKPIGAAPIQSYCPNTSAPNYTPNTVYEKSFRDKLKAFLGKVLLVVIVAAGIYTMITNIKNRENIQVVSDLQHTTSYNNDFDEPQSGELEKQ